MKTLPGLFTLAATLLLPTLLAAEPTNNPNLDIACVTRKMDEKTKDATEKSRTSTTKENWQYVVTLENKAFDDMKDLEVDYIIFFKQEELGSTGPAATKRQAGKTSIQVLKGHDKTEFRTDPVELVQAALSGGYYYKNGAKNTADANMAGIWIRVSQGGKVIAEYTRPSNLASKEKWDEAVK